MRVTAQTINLEACKMARLAYLMHTQDVRGVRVLDSLLARGHVSLEYATFVYETSVFVDKKTMNAFIALMEQKIPATAQNTSAARMSLAALIT